jgi:hypothetical protein
MAKGDGNTIGDKLIAAALDAFNIDPKFVAGSRYDEVTGEAVIVTNGGTKVRFKDGDKPEKLSTVAITGINPAPKKKPITGAGK